MGLRCLNMKSIYKPKACLSRLISCKNRTYSHHNYSNPVTLKSLANQSGGSYSSNSQIVLKRWHFGHSHHHYDEQSNKSENIFRLGLAADVGLAARKALIGYIFGSTTMIVDAAHSLSDVKRDFSGKADRRGAVHITIGDEGNSEGLARREERFCEVLLTCRTC